MAHAYPVLSFLIAVLKRGNTYLSQAVESILTFKMLSIEEIGAGRVRPGDPVARIDRIHIHGVVEEPPMAGVVVAFYSLELVAV